MNPLQKIIKMILIGRREIVAIGNFAVYESDFELEEASSEDRNKVYVDHQFLLLAGAGSEYLSFQGAHKETGISVNKLKKLVSNGEVESVEIGKEQRILRKSLERYMKLSKAN
jgi:hypothetical protein